MSSMRGGGGAGSYQYPQGSRPNTQPINYGNNQTNQDYSIPPNLYVERRSSNPMSNIPVNRPQQNKQAYSIPQSFYVEKRSTNPVPTTQFNQPQYIEPSTSAAGYQGARAIQAQSSSMYHHKNPGTPSRNVNPALKVNPPPYSQAPYASFGKESDFAKKETLGEIDDSPIIDPSAFRYLNLDDKKGAPTKKSAANESGIDTRPIVNLDGLTQLEKRRQQQIEKNNRIRGDDGSGPGIDGRSMVDANAFRHIEAKANKNKDNEQGGIDSRPITNPDAFKYLEARREPKPSKDANESSIDNRPIINPDAFKYLEGRRENTSKTNDESGIDTKPIVNPDAFRYLEQRSAPIRRDNESGIDTKSIVNPDAFRYLEQRSAPVRRDNEPVIDTKPIVNPEAFQHIERKGIPRPEITESVIDYRPIVPPQAFKWIEAKKSKPTVDDGPDIDERSYINPQSFLNIDRRFNRKNEETYEPEIDTRSFILDKNPNALAHLERQSSHPIGGKEESGIDERSFVNPNAFKYLEGMGEYTPSTTVHSSAGPAIDTKSYVNPNSFRHLEGQQRERNNENDNNDQGIDERSFVPSSAFRHLEFTGEPTNPQETYGHSDL